MCTFIWIFSFIVAIQTHPALGHRRSTILRYRHTAHLTTSAPTNLSATQVRAHQPPCEYEQSDPLISQVAFLHILRETINIDILELNNNTSNFHEKCNKRYINGTEEPYANLITTHTLNLV